MEQTDLFEPRPKWLARKTGPLSEDSIKNILANIEGLADLALRASPHLRTACTEYSNQLQTLLEKDLLWKNSSTLK